MATAPCPATRRPCGCVSGERRLLGHGLEGVEDARHVGPSFVAPPPPWANSLALVKRRANIPVWEGPSTRVALSMNHVSQPNIDAATRWGVENNAPVLTSRSGRNRRCSLIAVGRPNAALRISPEPTLGNQATSLPSSSDSVWEVLPVTHNASLASMPSRSIRICSSSRCPPGDATSMVRVTCGPAGPSQRVSVVPQERGGQRGDRTTRPGGHLLTPSLVGDQGDLSLPEAHRVARAGVGLAAAGPSSR